MKNKWYKRWRCLIAHRLYRTASAQTKRKIDSDAARYIAESPLCQGIEGSGLSALDGLLLSDEASFRSVFYYRCRKHSVLKALSRIFLREAKAVEIGGEIGEGLIVSHRHCVICPEKAGKNLRVGPGAVIYGEHGAPVLGNNIYIASDTVVSGNIKIGDNVVVGAGSVVQNDLEGNGVYLGKPARPVKTIDDNEAILAEIM